MSVHSSTETARGAAHLQAELDTERNGHSDHNGGNGADSKTKGNSLQRPVMQAIIQDFEPIWFTWCMNAGILSILLHQFPQPWHFRGINTLSTIAFVIDLVLFIIFSLLFLARITLYPRQSFHELTNSIPDLALLTCWPIAWLTLASLVSLVVSEAYWGGYWATILGYVMWWFGAAWTFGTLFFVLVIATRRHLAQNQPLPTLILMPAMGVATVATTGGLIAGYSSGISAGLAVPVIVFSYCIVGLGLLLAVLLYAMLWHNFLQNGWPSAEQTASFFILVGPMGQISAALQALANAAMSHGHFASYNRGTFLQSSATTPLTVASTLLALLLTGPSVFFTLFSIYCMVDRACQRPRKLTWTPTWNGIIFPTGTMCTSFIYFSQDLGSVAFRVFTAVVLVGMVVVWFVNLAGTIRGIARGEILVIREDWRLKKEMENEKREEKEK